MTNFIDQDKFLQREIKYRNKLLRKVSMYKSACIILSATIAILIVTIIRG